jgi:hypothetical protein
MQRGETGTTWVQQIVGQLVFNGAEDVNIAEISPWLDMRMPPKAAKLSAIEVQTHRRFLKTHLPVDALVFGTKTGCHGWVCRPTTFPAVGAGMARPTIHLIRCSRAALTSANRDCRPSRI